MHAGGLLAPPAEGVAAELEAVDELSPGCMHRDSAFVAALVRRRHDFGITRVGAITRLDRPRIPVVQVVRPSALSNAVAQGKGLTLVQAAASALMEALETWAGESIPAHAMRDATAAELGAATVARFARWHETNTAPDWSTIRLRWLKGWDLFTRAVVPVPAALVDTVYTVPSPHPRLFPRTTTGIGAGRTLLSALLHAGLEILERHAAAAAADRARFFDTRQVDLRSIPPGRSTELIETLHRARLVVGVWKLPSGRLPAFLCHIMDADERSEIVPLPAEGYGCDFTQDGAIFKAVLEACQARLTAIAGAREDITREHYPHTPDRGELSAWRRHITKVNCALVLSPEPTIHPTGREGLEVLLGALKEAGAACAIVVPLYRSEQPAFWVIRVVAPPLRHGRHA